MSNIPVNKGGRNFLRSLLGAKETGVFIPLILMIVVLSIFGQNFLTVTNIFDVLRSSSFVGIAAMGLLLTVLTGGLDLSVGSTMALGGILCSMFVVDFNMPLVLAIVVTLCLGGLIGMVNALLINELRMGAIIVTLGMLSVVRGLGFIITQGLPITGLPESFTFLGQGLLGGFFPVPILFFAGAALVLHMMLEYTVLGYHIFASGGNETASIYSGINVKKIRYVAYACSGALASLGGILLIARLGVAQPSIAVGYELSIVAAVIIGGASLAGGEGSVLGSVIGILIIAVISNGLVLMDIGGYYVQFANGSLILIAVAINRLRNRHREA
jgi:ribose/xylose/arabinose/galactoside ABC-type transport system permease subunit